MAEGTRVFSDATQNRSSGCKNSIARLLQKDVRRARYLDAKTSRWLTTDPALGEYIPMAPVNDEAKKHNQNLPGMGGIYNTVNMHLYHYAGNNPVKYTDPDGRFDRDQFIFSGIEMIGGLTECTVGYFTANVFSELHGLYNFADGLIGVVCSIVDIKWEGITSKITNTILNRTNLSEEIKDMIVLSIECLDIFISDICSTNLPDVGKLGQFSGNIAKIWNSVNSIACKYAEVESLGSKLEIVQNFILYLESLNDIKSGAAIAD